MTICTCSMDSTAAHTITEAGTGRVCLSSFDHWSRQSGGLFLIDL